MPPTDTDSLLSIVTNQRNRLRQRWVSLHTLVACCLDTVFARPVQNQLPRAPAKRDSVAEALASALSPQASAYDQALVT